MGSGAGGGTGQEVTHGLCDVVGDKGAKGEGGRAGRVEGQEKNRGAV